MGRITCANVISDLYAMGVCEIDSIDVIIKLSDSMSEQEQNIITPLILKGFSEAATEAKATISRVTCIYNPWCTIGGIATAVLPASGFIHPLNARNGDALVLTKPLGTQIACAASTPSRWARLEKVTTREEIANLRTQASQSMGRLNRIGALLMHKYEAHASTDVTGFGIMGHAENLAKFQRQSLTFHISRLPFMQNALKIAQALGIGKLIAGVSPETSGGLLIALPADAVEDFCKDIKEQEGYDAWLVGHVTEGERIAVLVDQPEIIEVPYKPENQ